MENTVENIQKFSLTFRAGCGTMGTVKENINGKENYNMRFTLTFTKGNHTLLVNAPQCQLVETITQYFKDGYALKWIRNA